jgi:hypothetical protein
MTMPKITLLKPHTHAGKDYQPGHTIEVNERQAKWLREIGVAAPEPELARSRRKPVSEPEPAQAVAGETAPSTTTEVQSNVLQ